MNTITLLSINSKYIHSSLSVWCLADGISRYSKSPNTINVIETTIHQSCEDITSKVAITTPNIVGISVYIWNAEKLLELLKPLRKKLPNTVFVLGGPEASYNQKFWLSAGADFVIQGEGEYKFAALIDKLYGYTPYENFSDNFIINPYSEDYFNTLEGRISYIETSRGCPFKCAYCLSGKDSSVRFLSIDTAKERIFKLSKSKTQTIKFVDRTFNANLNHSYKIFEYVISLDTNCSFHFEVAADLFDAKTLQLLSLAPPGRIQLEIGIQSFNKTALEACNRKTNLEKATSNIKTLLGRKNIHTHIDLIAGLPFETLADFKDGFDIAYMLEAHTLQLGFLKLLYGSALRENSEKLGILYSNNPPYEITKSPWLSENDFLILKNTENALQHTYNKKRFLKTLKYVLFVSKIPPFDFFHKLGEFAPNHATKLETYAEKIYDFCVKLPNIEKEKLLDYMVCDWLSMVKGSNMPFFLKSQNSRKTAVEIAQKYLGRKIRRCECAVLFSGKYVFIDSEKCDPITGLYKLYTA